MSNKRRGRDAEVEERVVKRSLQGSVVQKSLLPVIQEWVLNVSKATQCGALVFNRLLLYCLNLPGQPLPDFRNERIYYHCFRICSKARVPNPNPNPNPNLANFPLVEVWNRSFRDFPTTTPLPGDYQAYTYAAQKYMTNFINSLVYTFDGRQTGYITRWCEQTQIPKRHVRAIRYAINGWRCDAEVPQGAQAFVQEQRLLLRGNDGNEVITREWRKQNMPMVVKYFHHILQFMETLGDGKLFSLAPLCRIKSHFLTIDTRILYYMMKRNVNPPLTTARDEDEFRASPGKHFRRVFKLNGLCSSKGTFSHMVQTDGVSVCFHFHVPKETNKKRAAGAVGAGGAAAAGGAGGAAAGGGAGGAAAGGAYHPPPPDHG
jgi:hypothetical protein